MPNRFPRRATIALTVLVFASVFGGCSTSAEFSYDEVEFRPGITTERRYESRVYGDTERGLGRESCRALVRRQVNPLGELSSREDMRCAGD